MRSSKEIGKTSESLALFEEAERFVGANIDFFVDYAGAIGVAGAVKRDDLLLKDAFERFSLLHAKAPDHTMNLQYWAVTLFLLGDYAEAWKKVQLAEATPGHAELNLKFIEVLTDKMPRP